MLKASGKKRKAKHLTIFYFSFIAIALFSIHLSVYQFTTSDLEHLYAENRLNKIKQNSIMHLSALPTDAINQLAGQEFDVNAGYTNVKLYTDFNAIPKGFPAPESFAYDAFIELKQGPGGHAYIISKSQINLAHDLVDVYFILDNNTYELSEQQLLSMHTKQILISFVLFGLSLLVVFTISAKLTSPITNLAEVLKRKQANDLSPIVLETDVSTVELQQLIDRINQYQSKIAELVQRERSFNRYASHELRTPLMVLLGAVNILELSDDVKVVSAQRERIKKATLEMTEFVDTLLSLSRKETEQEANQPRLITENEVTNIVNSHTHLLEGKKVKWQISVEADIWFAIPESAFHILLGNLIKNAFAYTTNGLVTVALTQTGIQLKDTGKGLQNENQQIEGYGLGLLLVRDICHKYNAHFQLTNRAEQGTCATVIFDHESLRK